MKSPLRCIWKHKNGNRYLVELISIGTPCRARIKVDGKWKYLNLPADQLSRES